MTVDSVVFQGSTVTTVWMAKRIHAEARLYETSPIKVTIWCPNAADAWKGRSAVYNITAARSTHKWRLSFTACLAEVVVLMVALNDLGMDGVIRDEDGRGIRWTSKGRR